MRPLAVGVVGCALALIAVSQVQSAAAAIPIMGELQYGEAIIYGQASRLVHGQPLYQPLDRPPYTVASYTPIYYWLGAGLRIVFGDGFGPGRALSLVAGLGAAGLVGLIVGRGAGSRWAGAFGGLLFLALGLPWVQPRVDLFFAGDALRTAWANLVADMEVGTPWLGFYKEDVLGVAFAVASVAVLHGWGLGPDGLLSPTPALPERWRGDLQLVVAGLLAALAILTKQTLVAATVAGSIWLLRQDRRAAAVFGAVLCVVVGATVIALEVSTGAFFANVVIGNVNPMGLDVFAATIPVLIRFQAGPVLVAAIESARILRSGASRDHLLVYYWLATMLPLIGLAKVGSNHNHWTEFAASTAILAGIGLWRACFSDRSRWRSAFAIGALAATILAVMPLFGEVDRLKPSWPRPDPAEIEEGQALVHRVASEPREVLAAPLDLLALSDRPILLEPYIYSILERLGRWDSGPLVRRICAGEVGLLVFENPLQDGTGLYHGYPFWPDSVLDALDETMALEGTESRYYFYVPVRPCAR